MTHTTGYSHVIWDWNGTLLDDVDWCIAVMNRMLTGRHMRPIGSRHAYRSLFGFPVIDYYRAAGFDLDAESFESLSVEYMAEYHAGGGELRLFEHVEDVLRRIRENRIRQVVLSASQSVHLQSQLSAAHIAQYFDEILGCSDILAHGKLQVGLDWMERSDIAKAILVGDTVHDYEVAAALSVDCLLIANGHQSAEKLKSCGVPVLESLIQVPDWIGCFPI